MNTTFLLAAGWGQTLAGLLMFFTSLFLILLVLVQRGRGGGLSGAFGGMGGQSAFGTKAGDTFTRITIVAATLWIVLCMVSVRFLGNPDPSDTVFNDGAAEYIDDLSADLADEASAEGTSGGLDSASAAEGVTDGSEAGGSTVEAEVTDEAAVLSSSGDED